MDVQRLSLLEQAIEPYRREGFVITSQTEGAITLTLPPEKFSYMLFVILLLVWPLAVVYLVYHNNQGTKNVCVRVTAQGHIEESGYTLVALAGDRRRRIIIRFVFFSLIAVVALIFLMRAYLSRAQ